MTAAPNRIWLALTAFIATAAALIAVSAQPAGASGTGVFCGGVEATIVGTAGDDEITGTDGRDVIKGLGGDDVIHGLRGHDIICGDGGRDTIYGDRGDDTLFGGPGLDHLFGGVGRDGLFGKAGNDQLFGGKGHDSIFGGPGRDNLVGGLGDDVLEGNKGQDKLRGDNSSASGATAGADTLRGGPGNDNLWARWWYGDGDSSGLVHGGAGFDTCAEGATQTSCEWDGVTSDPGVWRPLVAEVFDRWGLAEETCSTAGGPRHCVGSQVDNAMAVLACESSGNPLAVNQSSGTSGLFQQHPNFWSIRVQRVRTHADIEPFFPANADPFDPEHNIIVAALLVWESKETQLLGDGVSNAGSLGGISPQVYPEFNFDRYDSHGYGYANWGEGPEPWGHWVGCASTGPPYNGVGLYDPSWIHPWAETQWP